jgi:homoserine trans-succinylase
MTDVLVFPTLTSEPIAAENMTSTTNLEMLVEQKQTNVCENVSEKRDIFFSRGHTGWE